MKFRPSKIIAEEYFKQGFKAVPISCEILSDIVTPITVLKKLKKRSEHCYLLESAEQDNRWGRYTFLGFNPTLEITCVDENVTIKDNHGDIKKCNDIKSVIRQVISDNKSPKIDYLPTFTGGLVGYFSYDFIKYSEKNLILDANDNEHFKDVDLMMFKNVIAFDNYRQKIILIVNYTKGDDYDSVCNQLSELRDIVLFGEECKEEDGKITSDFRFLFDKERYCENIKKAKEYIYDGDIFQVVLSNRIDVDFEGSLLNTYRVLRTVNPSPYMFYFSGQDVEIAGASPETLVKLEDGILYTFPLAGTMKRGVTDEEDKKIEEALLSDEKETAEHNMLVDLGRNDIGKVSKFGTVEVERYKEILKFSHVMHIGSTVKGIVRDDCDAIDVISSVLPAGTLSGAPKIRACEIINELEDNKRGIYGGAIGYIDFTGNMDTCIAIRIAYKKNGKVFVRSGAGIVADSVPEKEYEECINKAMAVMTSLKVQEEVE